MSLRASLPKDISLKLLIYAIIIIVNPIYYIQLYDSQKDDNLGMLWWSIMSIVLAVFFIALGVENLVHYSKGSDIKDHA